MEMAASKLVQIHHHHHHHHQHRSVGPWSLWIRNGGKIGGFRRPQFLPSYSSSLSSNPPLQLQISHGFCVLASLPPSSSPTTTSHSSTKLYVSGKMPRIGDVLTANCLVEAVFGDGFGEGFGKKNEKKKVCEIRYNGLSFRTTEESLRNAFQQFGELVQVNLVMDRIAKRPRGFAFLRYATEEESTKAIEGMHGKNFWMAESYLLKLQNPNLSSAKMCSKSEYSIDDGSNFVGAMAVIHFSIVANVN
ncbi:unnamed protein product [Camellia sinensis]